ncbi:DUF2510 domain-containing protein [Catenulispora sp. NF23]|uniref:DUF2510 domain-containing protein n=1 Tax=Catenulispora pinistramenti TaxID=2705254 RepID=UPI002E77DDA0|nr:DUF2510 domain-containing protein [Catenulispora pinistramenti]MBS2537591.1 DUF2510 domain-containing protein [Catenulispora pinistramenti]
MESSPRPGYYPDPSVPGYIRYWDGSKWVPGTSKPMPKKAGGGADADVVVESGAVPPPPRAAGASAAGSSQDDSAGSGISRTVTEAPASSSSSQSQTAKAPAFAPPRPLSEVSFDDAKPSADTFPGRGGAPEFPAAMPDFPAAAPEPKAPTFTAPKSLSDASFDDLLPDPMRLSPPPPGFGAGAGVGDQSATSPVGPVASASGMGISITGGPGLHVVPKQTPAQLSAGSQSLRIRLLRPDGKPFDGPEITTGPKQSDGPQGASRTEFDGPRGPKKQAPKIVVKAGPLERAGHTLAVLLISAIGIVPLGYLMSQSVHDREDKLAETISVPTKMNVLNGTSEAYLGGMVAVLLVVTVLYWTRLKRRRAR